MGFIKTKKNTAISKAAKALRKFAKSRKSKDVKMKAGRRLGSSVKLTAKSEKIYPQLKGKVGKVLSKEILTHGHGLGYTEKGSYTVGYHVKFSKFPRNVFIGASHLQKG